jgi:predicted RNase H-like HicB family nuclease
MKVQVDENGIRQDPQVHANFRTSGIVYSNGMELIFEVRDAEEGGYYARALGHPIFTQAETWEELRRNVVEAASLHFEDDAVRPRVVQLHYVRDELLPVEAA